MLDVGCWVSLVASLVQIARLLPLIPFQFDGVKKRVGFGQKSELWPPIRSHVKTLLRHGGLGVVRVAGNFTLLRPGTGALRSN